MATSGEGNQIVHFGYEHSATASELNKHLENIVKPGIYKGAELSIQDATTLRISPGVFLIKCTTGELVRIETQSNIDKTVSEATPYVISNFNWLNEENYADFDVKAFGSIYSNDIVFGKGVFSAGSLSDVNYEDRTYGLYNDDEELHVKKIYISSDTVDEEVLSLETQTAETSPNFVIIQSQKSTSGESSDTLITYVLDEDTTYLIESRVLARRTAGSGAAGESCLYVKKIGCKRVETGSAQMMGTIQNDFTVEDNPNWGCDFVVDGNNLKLNISGESGYIIDWHSSLFLQKI